MSGQNNNATRRTSTADRGVNDMLTHWRRMGHGGHEMSKPRMMSHKMALIRTGMIITHAKPVPLTNDERSMTSSVQRRTKWDVGPEEDCMVNEHIM